MMDGSDLLVINRRRHARKASVVKSETISKCWAIVLKKMNMAIYDFKVTFDLLKFGFVIMGPAESSSILSKGREGTILFRGKSLINWFIVWFFIRKHVIHLFNILLILF
ncbi:hypothetical protein TNCT_280321 [Trichonephila clavata]|uniref:Uncharacterized protein n=1 Tax=Trichonephila clavata TaxID=2740835 RepID=A0A8X6G548_TRICU|nr:hypothetical protein TNCT_280321 [Trichonephila clavata]